MLPCVRALILLNGFQVLDYVVHLLDLVRRDKLYPWKTYVAYEMFWGGVLICLIFALLFSWECMIFDNCSVPFMVLCTIHIIHVVPTMHNHLVCHA